jgi:hypothetical protein
MHALCTDHGPKFRWIGSTRCIILQISHSYLGSSSYKISVIITLYILFLLRPILMWGPFQLISHTPFGSFIGGCSQKFPADPEVSTSRGTFCCVQYCVCASLIELCYKYCTPSFSSLATLRRWEQSTPHDCSYMGEPVVSEGSL